jgi:tetratricopeptide (TPR) repeat protein
MHRGSIPVLCAALCAVLLAGPAAAYAPSAESACTAGLALVSAGNYTEAVSAFDRAIAIEPSYFEAWNGKADAYNRLGDYESALAASDRALAIEPSYVQGWINRGYILYNLGQYDEELAAYEKAIEIDPESPDAWFNRGYALAGLKRYDEAIASFDRVAEIDPNYPNLVANRRIAEKSAEAAQPFYIRHLPAITAFAVIAAAVLLVVLWARGQKPKTKKRKGK